MPHILCIATTAGGPDAVKGGAMTCETNAKQDSLADEFETRAATLRRVAEEMLNPEERAELLRIAAAYEQDAERLRKASPNAGS